MVHLPIHLADEAKVVGPVQYRWMYPIERYLSTLKSYVHNKCHPEGSIAEGYIAEECLTFCSRYLFGRETKFNRLSRNFDDNDSNGDKLSIFTGVGCGKGKHESIYLDYQVLSQAHRYVLFNCVEVENFIKRYIQIVRSTHRRAIPIDITRVHNETFPKWFQTEVMQLYPHGDVHVNEDLKWLAQRPNKIASRFKKYLINGFRFRIKDIDNRSKTQISGVVVNAKTSSFASSKDKNPIVGDVSYFGNVVNVIELDYYDGRKVALFKCDLIDINSNRGTKKNELGFTLVNPSCLLKTEEPFILASQAIQVFYVEDPVEIDWHAVVFTKPRDLYDMDEVANIGDLLMENESDNTTNLQQFMDNEDDVRDNVPGIMLNSYVNIIYVGAENNDSDDEDGDEYDN
ncbi:hypothetical protein Dsin_012789 [Dipteronia sinensis]|uniref:DUF4218 domain-containing protein n=1 Tax=Dipteronia sinensis TaxID=43782 RepID=A0AAE0AJY2_9ROSI|nr:hypothetical protein Dsin_012789 [Dipteronia sinensis]